MSVVADELTKEGVYRVKEDLLLKNFIDKSRSDKAKVLRFQQLKNYDEWIALGADSTLRRVRKQSDVIRSVQFSPASLIQDAIKEGNKYEVLDCLSRGVSINFNDVQGEGMSLLHQSCVYDDYIIAQALIKKGASVNMQDDYGCTPIHICCLWDSLKCAQLLISNNASTNILDVDNNFAVDLAPENSHLKSMMKKHMQQKLKIDESQLQSLRNKTQKILLQDIRQLLEENQSVDQTSASGISLLHIAVANGYVTAARMLLENSANVNAADLQMWTPLHCAAKYGQTKMVRLLLSHYANPHSKTTSGFTARELSKDTEIINMLSNAEDTFLDLDKQKTPAKTKRFSASLLDQCEDGENVTGTRTRTISSVTISKRDISREKEIISRSADELQQDIKSEICFRPPEVNTSLSPFAICNQVMPPPVPPRDDSSAVAFPLPLSPPPVKTNRLHDERMLYAVITIQRAFRRYIRSKRGPLKLCAALRILDDYGSSFYDEMVFQNAEDIARENDRQRSRKSFQRNSWSNDPRQKLRNSAATRPLSTGAILMPNAPDDSDIWLPQNPMHSPYHQMPPDVVPHYQNSQDYWNTMPKHIGGSRKLHKGLRTGSTDSGVSVGSNHKDYIELTKTVKQSLTIAENEDFQPLSPTSTMNRKSSLPRNRAPIQPTYRMPPLTPTVATLIHTASVTKKESPVRNGGKVMKPVAAVPVTTSHQDVYMVPDGPDNFRYKGHLQRDHRYGSLLSNRGMILRDARLRNNLNHQDLSYGTQNRHSWNCEIEESSTSFGSSSYSHTPVHPIISPPAATEMRHFVDDMKKPPENMPPPPSSVHSTLSRRSTKSDAMPPPPPRRAPTTKLSSSPIESVQHQRPRVGSLKTFGVPHPHDELSSRRQTQPQLSLPLRQNQVGDFNPHIHDSSPEEELPVIPPPLPLYTPQVLTSKESRSSINPNTVDLPAPPPPDVLLYDKMKNMSTLQRNQHTEDVSLDFPPPPPTL